MSELMPSSWAAHEAKACVSFQRIGEVLNIRLTKPGDQV